jgi:class 3 adenylate cyclase/tetratricopeptide (TPR) repeat protein
VIVDIGPRGLCQTDPVRCGVCGRENPSDATFCSGCGARLRASEGIEERKVVSVLFADLVGFTSRSEQLDVEDVRGTLAPFHARLRQVLESFGGTVEKFIGDAVMAVFGAPVAHEDDAERAVRAGLAIRYSLADLGGDLHVRIGINTGEALVSVGADPQSGEGMVAGDVVNTAARLQSASPVDGVLVGEGTFRAAQREIVFEAHPPIDAKGKAEPVSCWTAIEPRSLAPRTARESFALVGRESERRLLVGAFERCRAERRVQLVTIVGVPGIGKSRLVAELAAHVAVDPELTTWRQGQVLSYGTGGAFFALSEIVKQECGILDSDNALTAETKLDAAIADLDLEDADARWVRNQIGALIGTGVAADGSGQSEAFAGWRLFFETMAAQSPTVIILEDLHWADDALLDFTDGLLDRVSEVPLLVVATARPELLERRPGWAGGKINALTIGLAPLSPEHTAALIGEMVDHSLLSVDAVSLLLERADGNPLYAREYVRALVEQGSETVLPETVQGIIAARLDGLSTDEKSLLQDAAVIGATAWLGAVSALGGRDRFETDDLLLRLERKQLVRRARRSTIAGDVELLFTHALIREVAYSQLPRAKRAERHQRAADWLQEVANDRAETAELIAHHRTTALELHTALGNETETLRPAALTALTAAAQQAAAQHDPTAAVRYAETALTLLPDPPLRAELLALRAIAADATNHPDESDLLEARDAAVANGRGEDAVHLTYLLCNWAVNHANDTELAGAYETEALRLAADLPPGPITTLAAYGRAYRLMIQGRRDEAIELADREIARAIDAGADVAVGLMLIWRGYARAETGHDDGIADLREASRILEMCAHPRAPSAQYNLGDLLQGLGRLREASVAFEASAASGHRLGNTVAESAAALGAAKIAYHLGEPETVHSTLRGIPSDANDWTGVNALNTRGRLLIESAPHDARDAARAQLAYGLRTANREHQLDALALAARAELAMGDDKAANASLDGFIQTWTDVGGILSCADPLVEAGLVLAAYDRHRELAAATDLMQVATPWTDAARALAERRYTDAAAILDSIPSVPLRDAVLRLGADS